MGDTRKMKTGMAREASRMAALACCALLFAVCGCSREEPAAAAPSWDVDPAFRKELSEMQDVAKEIGMRRVKVAERMNEMKAIMREKLGTKDEKKVLAELGNNAEWRSLEEKAAAIDAEFEKQRQAMLSRVRRQMNGNGKVSK